MLPSSRIASSLRAFAFTHRAASTMPGGSDPMGAMGRAHSAIAPVRFQHIKARARGVAAAAATARARPGRRSRASASWAKTSDSEAATSVNRAIGRKSSRIAARKVKYAAGSQASATRSHPGSRRRSARTDPQSPSSPKAGVATRHTASGQYTRCCRRARREPKESAAIRASIA